MRASIVNSYLAHRQHVLPIARCTDVVHVTREIVALHATDPVGPYLSLWARMVDFRREALEDVLYERRELARMLCMRDTLHIVPSEEIPLLLPGVRQSPHARRASNRERSSRAGWHMRGGRG